PPSKAVIGSQDVPYIYEDRVSKEDFVQALLKIYNMPRAERKALGMKARENVLKNFGFEHYQKRWPELMQEVYEKHGSWETRKNYKSHICEEI
ncbi:MAG: hypothetical protein AAB907_02560, partial [Patescibacteria group bacterium]